MPEVTTVEKQRRTIDGQDREISVTTITGGDEIRILGGQEVKIDRVMIHDYGPGPKNGKTVTRSWRSTREVTEEELARNRARIQEAVNIAMRARGIW